jgi:hypothetical protein
MGGPLSTDSPLLPLSTAVMDSARVRAAARGASANKRFLRSSAGAKLEQAVDKDGRKLWKRGTANAEAPACDTGHLACGRRAAAQPTESGQSRRAGCGQEGANRL